MKTNPIYTSQFWLLCLSSFLFFASFNMLIAELPGYLSNMGGEEYKGLIISLFTITAGISRPFSGKLTDRVGRIPVMLFGSLVCVLMGFFYPLVTTVFPFLVLRFFHGFSTGFKPTATMAYIADIIPLNRRGEAMGIHGFIGAMGLAFGPAMGSEIALRFSLDILFYTSSAFALISMLILFNMKETLPAEAKEPFGLKSFAVKKQDIIEPKVLPAAFVVLLCYFSFGAVATLSPELSETVGLKNKGMYFFYYMTASLLVRIFAGKWSDKAGRTKVLKLGSFIVIIGMLITAFATNSIIFGIAAFVYGLGMGIVSPISQAWTIDLADDKHRGRGVATMFIALELGIGMGAFLPTVLFKNSLSFSFLLAAFFALMAFIYLQFRKVNVL